MATNRSFNKVEKQLREFALDYPDTVEEFPWGQATYKVNKKMFLYVSPYKGDLFISMKLPRSGKAAVKKPFASPTGYGLGKHGWVTARFTPGDRVPMELLTDWIDESFRAIAPKKLVAFLDDDEAEMRSMSPTRKARPAACPSRSNPRKP
jgi:predicted DNA-binding protein (MmcQ/YjbR family)